jgi:hypothetical protein
MSGSDTATPTFTEMLSAAMDSRAKDINIALPGTIVSYDPATQSCSVKPLIRDIFRDEEGEDVTDSLPIINKVPVMTFGGGGYRITFPIKKGDPVLIIFCDRSIDKWLATGGEVDPRDGRRHNLNDAIVIPGLRSFKTPVSDVDEAHLTIGEEGGVQAKFTGSDIQVGGSEALATKAAIEAYVQGYVQEAIVNHVHVGAPPIVPGAPSLNTDPGLPTAPPLTTLTGTTKIKGS